MTEKYLHSYSDEWVIKYNNEASLLKQTLGDLIIDIEHIGSTSIPGLSSKPIIDIAILTKSISYISIFTELLKKIRYDYKPEMSSEERIFLRKGEPIEYHLSISESKFTYWTRQILFRNYLRKYSKYRDEYQKLKEDAIKTVKKEDLGDISKSSEYASQKGPFILKILRLAEDELDK